MADAAPPLRFHQARALEALDRVGASGRRRAWVALPPGAGKTRVGVETIEAALRSGSVTQAVVLTPNTAIQGQWVAAAEAHGLATGTDRDLSGQVSCLTYQSVAVFDPDAEVAEDPDDPAVTPSGNGRGGLLERLHPNGRALVENLRAEPPLLLVLDECHHLLEVWGRLLGDVLHLLEDAQVLGLTATPPEALTTEQADLVAELFGEIAFRAGVPAVVKEGDLAPFAELAWLTTPTAHENEWLAGEAARFSELTTHLTDPTFGTVPFLEWLTSRFVSCVPHPVSWGEIARADPALADAALRMSEAGLMALPHGARVAERHRRRPDAEDWVALLGEWVVGQVASSDDDRDREVLAAVRRALPSVGFVLTRRGIRRGRTPVDRVLARSLAKTTAAVEIVAHEVTLLGPRTRLLVLCDHERASATLPTGLQGVLDAESGSAYAALEALVTDPATAGLSPLLVTGSTVAGHPLALTALAAHVAQAVPRLAGRLEIEGEGPVARLTGPWSSRDWVRPVTTFFESGQCQVLVGTRGLLGEGWDARRITGLVDLTTATTLTAVVQTRGRALRTDPAWPEKVAINWSVVCVSESHPKGRNDWDRLVRKHAGFHGVDDDGDIVDGVGHIDATFSPYAPPPTEDFGAINARMRDRAAARERIRDRWRVGEPYADRVAATLRVIARGAPAPPIAGSEGVARLEVVPAPAVLGSNGIEVRDPAIRPPAVRWVRDAVAAGLAAAGGATAAAAPVLGWYALAGGVGIGAGAGLAALAQRDRSDLLAAWVVDTVVAAADTPSIGRVAAAVADGLRAAGLNAVGAEGLVIEVHPGAEHRCRLDADAPEAARFVEALDEALAPLGDPRYVIGRPTLTGPPTLDRRPRTRAGALAALRSVAPSAVAWHQVPSVLGTNAARAAAFAGAWAHWVAPGRLVFTGYPEGEGVLVAQQGADPFAATSVMRQHWL